MEYCVMFKYYLFSNFIFYDTETFSYICIQQYVYIAE